MSVYKVNVSLPQELVDRIDAAAAEQGLSRSAFIALASSHFLAEAEEAEERARRARDIDEARAAFLRIGRSIPQDFDYVGFIRTERERRRLW